MLKQYRTNLGFFFYIVYHMCTPQNIWYITIDSLLLQLHLLFLLYTLACSGEWFNLPPCLILCCCFLFVCATFFHPPSSVSSALHSCVYYIGYFTVLGGFSSLCYSRSISDFFSHNVHLLRIDMMLQLHLHYDNI